MTLPLCLILLRICSWCLGAKKVWLCDKNISIPKPQSQNSSGELEDVRESDRLRCLHCKVATTILWVYVYCVLLALPSVLGASP